MTDSAPLTRIARRLAAGWTLTPTGWISHENTPESDWFTEARPFPEDPDYAEWHAAYYHYEALDAGLPEDASPYPFTHHLPASFRLHLSHLG